MTVGLRQRKITGACDRLLHPGTRICIHPVFAAECIELGPVVLSWVPWCGELIRFIHRLPTRMDAAPSRTLTLAQSGKYGVLALVHWLHTPQDGDIVD